MHLSGKRITASSTTNTILGSDWANNNTSTHANHCNKSLKLKQLSNKRNTRSQAVQVSLRRDLKVDFRCCSRSFANSLNDLMIFTSTFSPKCSPGVGFSRQNRDAARSHRPCPNKAEKNYITRRQRKVSRRMIGLTTVPHANQITSRTNHHKRDGLAWPTRTQ